MRAAIKSRRCREIYKLPESQRRAPLLASCSPLLLISPFSFSSILFYLGFYQSPESHWGSSPHSSSTSQCPVSSATINCPEPHFDLYCRLLKSFSHLVCICRIYQLQNPARTPLTLIFRRRKKRVLLTFSFPLLMSFNGFPHFPTQ